VQAAGLAVLAALSHRGHAVNDSFFLRSVETFPRWACSTTFSLRPNARYTVRQRRVHVSHAPVVGLCRSLCFMFFVQYRCQCRAREGKEGFHHAEEDVS
jgi:hypothetical protein